MLEEEGDGRVTPAYKEGGREGGREGGGGECGNTKGEEEEGRQPNPLGGDDVLEEEGDGRVTPAWGKEGGREE